MRRQQTARGKLLPNILKLYSSMKSQIMHMQRGGFIHVKRGRKVKKRRPWSCTGRCVKMTSWLRDLCHTRLSETCCEYAALGSERSGRTCTEQAPLSALWFPWKHVDGMANMSKETHFSLAQLDLTSSGAYFWWDSFSSTRGRMDGIMSLGNIWLTTVRAMQTSMRLVLWRSCKWQEASLN